MITGSDTGEIAVWSLEDWSFSGFVSVGGPAVSCLTLNRSAQPRMFASGLDSVLVAVNLTWRLGRTAACNPVKSPALSRKTRLDRAFSTLAVYQITVQFPGQTGFRYPAYQTTAQK
jgi:hypothetical protein